MYVDLPQLTAEKPFGCTEQGLKEIKNTTLELRCGESCKGDKCNFLCKWFTIKNKYLYLELAALKEYLGTVPDNYFQSEIEEVVESSNRNRRTPQQFSLLKDYVDG